MSRRVEFHKGRVVVDDDTHGRKVFFTDAAYDEWAAENPDPIVFAVFMEPMRQSDFEANLYDGAWKDWDQWNPAPRGEK